MAQSNGVIEKSLIDYRQGWSQGRKPNHRMTEHLDAAGTSGELLPSLTGLKGWELKTEPSYTHPAYSLH